MPLDPTDWLLVILAALIIGFSKTGISGLGLLAVALFNLIFPATKQVSGLVLPLLLVGDLVAVSAYRRHTQWRFLWKLFPWTAAGVLLGWFAMGRINDHQARFLVGAIITTLVILQLLRRRAPKSPASLIAPAVPPPDTPPAHGPWFAPTLGILAGFTTLVANAAGPLMAVYLLAMRLPKMEFVGTGAVFFLFLNAFKVPFMINLGLITPDSARFNLYLAPAVIAGALLGRWILPRINQKFFETAALALAAAAGLKMLLS